MAKITRTHIIAARGRKNILESQKKPVPAKIAKLAKLDPAKFPRESGRKGAIAGRLPSGDLWKVEHGDVIELELPAGFKVVTPKSETRESR